ncbi:MAG TPA: LamG domain-containing protein [Turneriella sp.]|nr:LamG domain-containing protein [Turneriella sp.]
MLKNLAQPKPACIADYVLLYAPLGIWPHLPNAAAACVGKFSLTGAISVNSVLSTCGAGVNCQKFTLTTTTQSAATPYTLTAVPNVATDLAGRTIDAVNTATYPSGDVMSNLLAHYKFDGNANDTQGTYNPTFNSATLANDRFGNSNRSYNFSGTTRIEVPPINFNSTGVSVSAWINFASIGAFSSIARDDSATIALTLTPTVAAFQLNLPGFGYHNVNATINAADYTDGNWHHIVGTYDGAFFRIYKDGAEIGNSAYNFAGTLSTGTVQAIGGTASGENCFGRIDEVRFYNRGLTAAEVASLYLLEK